MWLTKITNFVSGYKWVFTVLSALSALIAIATYIDTNAYNRAVNEYTAASAKAIKKATDEAITKANLEMQQALDKQAETHAAELAFSDQTKETKTTIEEIIKYVDKVEVKNECINVDADVISLLNQAVDNRGSKKPKPAETRG